MSLKFARQYRSLFFGVILIVVSVVGFFVAHNGEWAGQDFASTSARDTQDPADPNFYFTNVQPVLEHRCIACHGCYSAPCQMNMQSPEGLARGMHEKPEIYDPGRLAVAPVTRLESDWRISEDIPHIAEDKDALHVTPYGANGVHFDLGLQQLLDYRINNWRSSKGFRSVTDRDPASGDSIFLSMLGLDAQGRPSPNASISSPSDQDLMNLPRFDTIDGSHKICAANAQDVRNHYFVGDHTAGRMPYGFAALKESEMTAIARWATQGNSPRFPEIPAYDFKKYESSKARGINWHQDVINKIDEQVSNWHNFLNARDAKHELVARYIYEHYFLAHIWFKEAPDMYFRLVRSSSNCGNANEGVKEIVTRRPNDAPPAGVSYENLYYCLVPLNQIVVEKNHMPVLFSPEKQRRVLETFFSEPWSVAQMPTYNLKESANPFITFQSIPAKARYRFLLDEAQYEVSTFIKGPVCYGNGAINVVQEQFYVYFLRPESDPLVVNNQFYNAHMKDLSLPGSLADENNVNTPTSKWGRLLKTIHFALEGIESTLHFGSRERAFEKARMQALNAIKQGRGLSANDLWDGKGSDDEGRAVNDNAVLTGFRNSESAYVVKGLQGDVAKTFWIFDYSLFERTIYDLVVNFDVFDDVRTQALTRVYMGYIREDAENMFLNFMPKAVRQKLHASWYDNNTFLEGLREGQTKVHYDTMDEPVDAGFPAYSGGVGRAEVDYFVSNAAKGPLQDVMSLHVDPLNWRMEMFPQFSNSRPLNKLDGPDDIQIDAILKPLTARGTGETFPLAFPDTSYLFVQNGTSYKVYVINRNKEVRTPVMISDPVLDAENNSLTITKDLTGSYPNLFFVVGQDQLQNWVSDVRALRGSALQNKSTADRESANLWNQLIHLNGIQKTDPRVWTYYDLAQDYFNRRANADREREAGRIFPEKYKVLGVIDLSRYGFTDTIETK